MTHLYPVTGKPDTFTTACGTVRVVERLRLFIVSWKDAAGDWHKFQTTRIADETNTLAGKALTHAAIENFKAQKAAIEASVRARG